MVEAVFIVEAEIMKTFSKAILPRHSLLVALFLWDLMLVGCQTNFVHPSKNAADFEQDKYDCRVEAEQSAYAAGQAGNGFWLRNRISYCLQAKHGWRPEPK